MFADEVDHAGEVVVGAHRAAQNVELIEEHDLRADIGPVAQRATVQTDAGTATGQFDQIGKTFAAGTVDNDVEATGLLFQVFGPVRFAVVCAATGAECDGTVDLGG